VELDEALERGCDAVNPLRTTSTNIEVTALLGLRYADEIKVAREALPDWSPSQLRRALAERE
jgi:hypothetical protein